MEATKFKGTTILGVKIGKKVAIGGDGQVTLGDTISKQLLIKYADYMKDRSLQVLLAQPPMRLLYLKI